MLARHLCRSRPLLKPLAPARLMSSSAPLIVPSRPVNVALCQIHVGADKTVNLATAGDAIAKAVTDHNASIVILPECFNSPYSTASFPEYAEPLPSVTTPPSAPSTSSAAAAPTVDALSAWARTHKVFLIGGSIPEKGSDGSIYNTSMVFGPTGELLARHRKAHLFDIDIPGRMTFKESDALTGGSDITTVDLDLARTPAYGPATDAGEALESSVLRVGLGICYDIRFTEYAQICAARGAGLLVYPGAFNMTTGPAHWELLQRAHAVGQQVFVASCSPARATEGDGYKAWGHSMAVDPWGTVLVEAQEGQEVVGTRLDFDRAKEIRAQIPITLQRRTDLYGRVPDLTE